MTLHNQSIGQNNRRCVEIASDQSSHDGSIEYRAAAKHLHVPTPPAQTTRRWMVHLLAISLPTRRTNQLEGHQRPVAPGRRDCRRRRQGRRVHRWRNLRRRRLAYAYCVRATSTTNVYTITKSYTLSGMTVRTNIVIDDKLMKAAIKATGAKTKREAVELGLRTLVQLKKQQQIRGLRGKTKMARGPRQNEN